ncbi:MAG: hypothetical protein ACYCU8_01255 [Ferrimicrobium acidiphilum]
MRNFERLKDAVESSISDAANRCMITASYGTFGVTGKAYDKTKLVTWLCQTAIDTRADINHIHLNQTQLDELIDVLGVLSIVIGLASGDPLPIVAEGAVERYAIRQLILDAGKRYDARRPNFTAQVFCNKKNIDE